MLQAQLDAIESALAGGTRKVYKWEVQYSTTYWVGWGFHFSIAEL